MYQFYTEYELDAIELARRTPTEQEKPDAAVESLKAIIATATDEHGCYWCDRSGTWGHEDWCPIPEAMAAVAAGDYARLYSES